MTKSVNGNLNEDQLTLEKELKLEGAYDKDLEMGKKKPKRKRKYFAFNQFQNLEALKKLAELDHIFYQGGEKGW